MRAYPFEEAFFLPLARRFRAAVRLPLMLLGGVTRLDTMERALDEGFEFVAMGRALIRDPDLVAPDAVRRAHRLALRAVQPLRRRDGARRHPLRDARPGVGACGATPGPAVHESESLSVKCA